MQARLPVWLGEYYGVDAALIALICNLAFKPLLSPPADHAPLNNLLYHAMKAAPLVLICISCWDPSRLALLCCRSRTFQYGLKYYAMNAALLTLIIALQANVNLTSWHPVFVVGSAHHLSIPDSPTPDGSGRIIYCMSALHNVPSSLKLADMCCQQSAPSVLRAVLFIAYRHVG